MSTMTLQTNIKQHTKDMTQYSLFLGGLNATSKALAQYDPIKTGYGRVFMIKMPKFMDVILPTETKQFKHLLEYGSTSLEGLGNTTLEFEQMSGGYAGRAFDVATVAKDETAEVTVKMYESAGSPVRTYLDMWVSGISDPYTGIGHYHGAMDIDPTVKYAQSNHVAEMIYVSTDPTGREDGIEYACLLTNMMPKSVKKDHFNYNKGEHAIVEVDCQFTCVKYESPQINEIAKALLRRFKILRNYLHFDSGYTQTDVDNMFKPDIQDWKNYVK